VGKRMEISHFFVRCVVGKNLSLRSLTLCTGWMFLVDEEVFSVIWLIQSFFSILLRDSNLQKNLLHGNLIPN
jgi:hypothetical protein